MIQNGIVLVVSVSIVRDNQVLIIKENKPLAIDKWNFPSGRIEQKEDILLAACREVQEETGLEVNLQYTTGIYNFVSDSNDQVILFHFIGEIIGGSIQLEEDEIVDYKWIQLSELIHIENEALRNANVNKQIINNLLRNNVYSISIFNEQLVN